MFSCSSNAGGQRLPTCRRCGIQLFLGDTATLGRCVEKGVDFGWSWNGSDSLRQQIGLRGVGQQVVGSAPGLAGIDADADQRVVEDTGDETRRSLGRAGR